MRGYNAEKVVAFVIVGALGMIVVGGAAFRFGLLSLFAAYALISLGLPLLLAGIVLGLMLSRGWAPAFMRKVIPSVKIDHKFFVGDDGNVYMDPDFAVELGAKRMVKVLMPGYAQAEFVVDAMLFDRLLEGETYRVTVQGGRMVQAVRMADPTT